MRIARLSAFGAPTADECRQIIELSPSSPEAAACRAALPTYVSPLRTVADRTLIQAETTGVQDVNMTPGRLFVTQQAPIKTAWSPTTIAPPPVISTPVASPAPREMLPETTIAPPPVKVVDTSTSAPPPAPSGDKVREDPPAVKDEPPSIEPEKKTEIKPPPVIVVDSDTGSQINRGGGGGSIYPSDGEATGEEIEAAGQGQVIATASSGFWTFANLKWPLGLIAGALVLFVVLPKIRRKKSGSLSGYGRRRFRAIPEDALD